MGFIKKTQFITAVNPMLVIIVNKRTNDCNKHLMKKYSHTQLRANKD